MELDSFLHVNLYNNLRKKRNNTSTWRCEDKTTMKQLFNEDIYVRFLFSTFLQLLRNFTDKSVN